MSTVDEVLGLGDDALIAAQRLAEWTTNAPELEEDIALANIALDLLGQARMLLTYAGELEGAGRDEDALAYLRTDREFRNVQLTELPRGDFADAIVRMLFFAVYQRELYDRLLIGPDARLAEIAGKAAKEVAYHVDHAALWTLRLGDGTPESHRRAQEAVDRLWPYTFELFEGEVPREAWLSTVDGVLAEATLTRPADEDARFRPTGGRSGVHTEHLSYLLAEMQVLHRAHPGASW
ncbi:1,2-phenylacetyl-CoA epoxidase subunit PaaC [Phytomonospora sp. NPDC050363]|uniref:1,2-phenylacetyl-CoA epoxidase subunit PaaC n=1 Tax=Phytomonospora sp. NPDC050363 TaxID=3155642 RepID=UPI0033D20352